MPAEKSPITMSMSGLLNEPLRTWLGPVEPTIKKILAFDQLQRLYDEARGPEAPGDGTVGSLLRLLQITYELDESELQHIPTTGPVVVVANHPFGLLEGA